MNTKLTFYWTSAENDKFEKTVFQTIIEDKFESSYDAQNWMDENSSYIYHKFDFALVFDHVLVSFEDTDEVVSDVEIVKSFPGKIVFSDDKEIEELKEQVRILNEKLELEVLKRENKEIREEIEKVKSELPKKDFQSCWIDLSGKQYNVSFGEHNNFAFDILQSRYEMTSEELCFGKYAYEILQDKGWCRVLGWSGDEPRFVIPERVTPKMKKAIKDYCQQQGCRYPNEINID